MQIECWKTQREISLNTRCAVQIQKPFALAHPHNQSNLHTPKPGTYNKQGATESAEPAVDFRLAGSEHCASRGALREQRGVGGTMAEQSDAQPRPKGDGNELEDIFLAGKGTSLLLDGEAKLVDRDRPKERK